MTEAQLREAIRLLDLELLEEIEDLENR